MKTYKVTCRVNGKQTTSTIEANNTSEALMNYLKSISNSENKLSKDYKINIELV